MPKQTPQELYKAANKRLKESNCAVKLSKQGGRLYLRGTLPPKPGNDRTKPSQQRINRGYFFNAAAIKCAETDAHQVTRDLMMGTFDWKTWSATLQQASTIGQLIPQFEQDYFNKRDRNPKSKLPMPL